MEPFVYEARRTDLRRAHDRLLSRACLEVRCMKVKLEEVERYERHVKIAARLPASA